MNPPALPTKIAPWGISKTLGDVISSKKESIVKYVEFNITGRCQVGCITCPSTLTYPDEKIHKKTRDLVYEFKLFQSYFTKLKKLGLEFVTIYGREPTLWDKEADEPNKFLQDMISWLNNELKVKVCLATSGIGLRESVLKVLFDNEGVLFMKDWGSKKSVEKLIKSKDAYLKMQKSWKLVKSLKKRYKKTRVVAEFLYTGINRGDLTLFWERCLKNGILPFVEVPIIKGRCADNFKELKIKPEVYVRDIYELSLLNLSLLYGLTKEEVRHTNIWQPPYGSVFPSPCNKLTHAQGLFLERNGNLSACCGVSTLLGNINDKDIKKRLQDNFLLSRLRNTYDNLQGFCGSCDYSRGLHVCYGCRGNADTYQSSNRGVFGEDVMCFGKVALKLAAEGKLAKFMSKNHIDKIREYF